MSSTQLLLFLLSFLAPGMLLVRAGGAGLERSLVAVPASCGITYVLGNYLGVVGVPVFPWVLLGGCVLGVAAVVVCRADLVPKRPDRHQFLSAAVLLCGGLVLVLMWRRASGSFGQLLPNHDAMYHSYVIRNIMETNSMRVGSALRLFPDGSGTAADFYPLGLHGTIAQAARLSGSSINASMNVVVVAGTLLLFPTVMYAWTRRLIGVSRFLPITTVIAVVLMSPVFPFSPFSWGGMPALVGMGVAPAVALVLDDHLADRTRFGRVLTIVVLVGLFGIHSPELVLALLLTVPLLVARGGEVKLRGIVREAVIIGAWSFLLLLPVLVATAGGAAERDLVYQARLDLVTSTGQTVLFGLTGISLPLVTVLVALGLGLAVRRGFVTVAVGLFVVVVVVIVAGQYPTNSLVRFVTKPWYGQVLRLNYNIVYFAVPAAALALGGLVEVRRRIRRVVALVVIPMIAVFAVGSSVSAGRTLLDSWYGGLVPPNRNSIEAFNWMASNLADDEYVMTDHDGIDESTWMYAISGAKPIMYGAITEDSRDTYRPQKSAILGNIGRLAERPDLLAFIRTKRIRYFYFDERTNAVSPDHTVSLKQLREDESMTEVFVSANAHVFEFNR